MFFAGSLFEVYFFNMGLSIPEIYLADGLWFVASLIMLPFLKRFKTKPFILAGIAVSLLTVLLLLLYPEPGAAYLYRLLLGSTHILFWLPFNTAFFEFRKQNNAGLSAIYYAVPPILYLLLPAVSGTLAEGLGFAPLYLLSVVTYVASFVLGYLLLKDKEYSVSLKGIMKSVKGIRCILFLEGFSVHAITSITLPTMLLLYLNTPAEFGWFLSLSTIFSIAASFIVSSLSDSMKKRWLFIIPSAAGFALASILASIAHDLALFFLAFGAINFFARLFTPLSLALAVDHAKNLADSMAAREFLLNIGRFSSVLLGYLIMLQWGIEAALLMQGLTLLLYIPLYEFRTKKNLRL